jgi:isopenicillin N synthase-like dioxygenase
MQTPPLPVISLAAHPDTASLAVELGRACHEEGFIYLSDHGIPAELTDEAFGISERYFADARPEDKVDLKENTGYTAV